MQKCGEDSETPCRLCHLVFTVASMTSVLRPLFDPTGEGYDNSHYPSYEKREVRVAIEHRRRNNMAEGFMALDFDFADRYPGLQFLFVPIESKKKTPDFRFNYLPDANISAAVKRTNLYHYQPSLWEKTQVPKQPFLSQNDGSDPVSTITPNMPPNNITPSTPLLVGSLQGC